MTFPTLEQMEMVVRPGTVEDYGYVYDSMVNSLHDGNPTHKCMRMRLFKRAQRDRIAKVLSSPWRLLVVTSTTDSNMIYGWAMHDWEGTLHYVYVSHLWRNKGIATNLLCSIEDLHSYANWTFAFRSFARKLKLEYVPTEYKKYVTEQESKEGFDK